MVEWPHLGFEFHLAQLPLDAIGGLLVNSTRSHAVHDSLHLIEHGLGRHDQILNAIGGGSQRFELNLRSEHECEQVEPGLLDCSPAHSHSMITQNHDLVGGPEVFAYTLFHVIIDQYASVVVVAHLAANECLLRDGQEAAFESGQASCQARVNVNHGVHVRTSRVNNRVE